MPQGHIVSQPVRSSGRLTVTVVAQRQRSAGLQPQAEPNRLRGVARSMIPSATSVPAITRASKRFSARAVSVTPADKRQRRHPVERGGRRQRQAVEVILDRPARMTQLEADRAASTLPPQARCRSDGRGLRRSQPAERRGQARKPAPARRPAPAIRRASTRPAVQRAGASTPATSIGRGCGAADSSRPRPRTRPRERCPDPFPSVTLAMGSASRLAKAVTDRVALVVLPVAPHLRPRAAAPAPAAGWRRPHRVRRGTAGTARSASAAASRGRPR
jgi:hypothetical protein